MTGRGSKGQKMASEEDPSFKDNGGKALGNDGVTTKETKEMGGAIIVPLDMMFPRPREQIILKEETQDIFHPGQSRQGLQRSQSQATSQKNTAEDLVMGVLAGEFGNELLDKIEKAGDAEMLHKIRVEIKQRVEMTSKEGDNANIKEVTVQMSVLHLAIIENRVEAFVTLLKFVTG